MPESLICPQCGAPNPLGSQSCANCGWAPSPPPQQGPPQGYEQPSYGPQGGYGVQQPYQPYDQAQPYGPAQPYEQAPPYDDGPGRGRRLLLIIVPIAIALALVAVFAVIFVPRLLHRGNQPVTPPASTASPSAPQKRQTPQQTPTSSPKPTPTKSTKPAVDYSKLGPKVSSGILKIIATGCRAGGSGVGSAFLISNRTAVASLSSLAGGDVIAVSNGSDTFAASVAGVDLIHGLVILKLDHAASGHIFSVDDVTPAVGDPVGSYGVPAGLIKPGLIKATVESTGAAVKIGTYNVGGLAGTSATADNGISGAPTLAANGDANGMVLLDPKGKIMIVPGKMIKAAASHPSGTLPKTHCQNELGPSVTAISGSAPTATKSLFTQYFGGINSGNYRAAFNQLSQQLRSTGYRKYADGWATTYDFNIDVHKASNSGAHVTFDSIFTEGKGPAGTKTCARWDIDYQFVSEGGHPVIDKARPHSGSIFHPC